MLNYTYKSYRVIGDKFTYIEVIDGREVHKAIPLRINGEINPKTIEIVNEINRVNSLINDMTKKAKKALMPKPEKKETPTKTETKKEDTPLKDFYERLKNPLDDPEIINNLIRVYSLSTNNLGGFYGRLSETFCDEKKYKRKYFPASKDNFYASLFNKWKASVIQLKKEGRLAQHAEVLYQKLSKIPDTKTFEEVQNIVYSDEDIEKFYWDSYFSSWTHVKSHHIDMASKDRLDTIEHRLYVSTEGVVVHDFAMCFINKCLQRNIPYYFKFDDDCARDDSFVIYADTKHLMDYVSILEEIKKEHPKLVELCKTPPVLTGRVNEFVGYGSEPSPDEKGKNRSFNDVRAKLLERSFDKTLMDWITTNSNMRINYMNRVVTIGDWICHEIANTIYGKHKSNFEYYKSKNNIEHYFKTYGLIEEDFNSPNFKNHLYKHIKNNYPGIINNPSILIEVPIRNGKTIKISNHDLKNTLKVKSPIIFRNKPELKDTLRKNIDMEARKEGIDITKFCFDEQAKLLLEQGDALYRNERIKSELLKVRTELMGNGYQSPIETGTYVM